MFLQCHIRCRQTIVIWCRACVAVGDRLFVIGGQEGDFMAKPGSPIFKCSRRVEVSFSLFINIKHDLKRKYYDLVVVFLKMNDMVCLNCLFHNHNPHLLDI